MSRLLKEIEAGPNEELLAKTLAAGLTERTRADQSGTSRRAREHQSADSILWPAAPPELADSTSPQTVPLQSTNSTPLPANSTPIEVFTPLSHHSTEPGTGNPASPKNKTTQSKVCESPTTKQANAPMSSQRRSGTSRGASRVGPQESGEEAQLWADVSQQLLKIDKLESKAKDLNSKIFEKEKAISENQDAGTRPSPADLDFLDSLYREQVKTAEEIKHIMDLEDVLGKTEILRGLMRHNEDKAQELASTRSSNSRSAMDFDGPSDSPVPSPAENKFVRKLGGGRNSSQPPKDKETSQEKPEAAEPSSSRTKITFSIGQEVAFKPKPVKPGEEKDWILGEVVKIIGEGKSRRYDVQDPYPDQVGSQGDRYRSSASSMVPIPSAGSLLADYEPGKQVLAMYPGTSTFYRAEVKCMLDGGAKVELLFEDDLAGALKTVERRHVLDHKG